MNWPAYPEYKDSGVGAIDKIPKQWVVGALKRWITSVESGTSVNAADIAALPGQVGVLKTSCVYTGQFDIDENKTVVPEELDRVTCEVTIGSLIVSRMNTPDLVGSAGYVKESRPGIYLPDRLWQVNFEGLSAKWVGYWSKTQTYRDQIRLISVGASSSMHNISQPDYGAFLLAVPPQDEQDAISDFLDRETTKIDALIDKQNQLIATLREDRTATITHAVTKGLNPDAEMEDTGVAWLGEMPRHWSVSRFSRHIAIRGGQVDPRLSPYRDMPLIAPNHVESRTGVLIGLESAADQGADSGKYLVDSGRIIYSKIRPNLAKAVIAPCNCLCSADMYALSPDRLCFETAFVLRMLLSKPFTDYVVDSSMRVAMPKVNHESLGAAPVWIPPLEEQRAIITHLDSECARVDTLIAKAAEVIEMLREFRSALITAAVTGKIDVREVA